MYGGVLAEGAAVRPKALFFQERRELLSKHEEIINECQKCGSNELSWGLGLSFRSLLTRVCLRRIKNSVLFAVFRLSASLEAASPNGFVSDGVGKFVLHRLLFFGLSQAVDWNGSSKV
jgi:hypothetical protein